MRSLPVDPDLNTHRFALLCLLVIAGLLALYFVCPVFVTTPFGILFLILPGTLLIALYLAKLFRP